MAPSIVTDDYYAILEVNQTATLDIINKSYRRLALKLHPDRGGSTQLFQLLGAAYETLKDDSKRRAYDLIYPSISRSRPIPKSTNTSRPPPTSTPQSDEARDNAQLAMLRRQKEQRGAHWAIKRREFESSISEIKKIIQRLEQEIKNLTSIAAAEAAVDARKNSWATWFMSPVYKQVEESEDEKARKDIERQERRVEKDWKERKLGVQQAQLREKEKIMNETKSRIDAADLCDDNKIRTIIEAMEARERRAKAKAEEEMLAKMKRQAEERLREQQLREQQLREVLRQEQLRKEQLRKEQLRKEQLRKEQLRKEQEAAEAFRKAAEAAGQKAFDEEMGRFRRTYMHSNSDDNSTRQSRELACSHAGWWAKVQGRTACPKCYDVWTYMLQRPGCATKACPKCQREMRPRFQRNVNTARTPRRDAPRRPKPRSPSPYYMYSDWD
ncbi:DnaJ domain-containing protein, protein [Acrodontium crateriforme]|uniref:DnaJ domain-containing protein, protein n=1 Tax=Acrodontium crateriforme TaxID=150365 RepID=A0AAQ3M9L0_9PEZI|nr:DnaJ domain-containing protein, protein [Acrodontium crateriforme]